MLRAAQSLGRGQRATPRAAWISALATTSSGFAWSQGRPDNGVSLDATLLHLRAIAAAITIPVNADFEGGFAVRPDAVGANVTKAAATGIAGLSIEDSTGDSVNPLLEFSLAVERVRAARAAIDETGTHVLLTARSKGSLSDERISTKPFDTSQPMPALAPIACTRRAFGPADIKAVVDAVAPKPVNVLVGSDFATVEELRDLGVRRISVGGALARAAWTASSTPPGNRRTRHLYRPGACNQLRQHQ